MVRVLVVDDAKPLRNALIRELKKHGCDVLGIGTASLSITSLAIFRPDAVVLDLVVDEDTDTLEVCQTLRYWKVPVVVLSAFDDEETRRKTFDAGASDYLLKPIDAADLFATLQSVLNDEPATLREPDTFQVGTMLINLTRRQILWDSETIRLTRYECGVLKTLLLAEGRPVTYETLLTNLLGPNHAQKGERATIRVVIKQLRRKLKDDPDCPLYPLTETGVGYRININAVEDGRYSTS